MKEKKSTYHQKKDDLFKQFIDDLRCFRHGIKMEYHKITNATSSNIPRFITKNWIEVYDQSGGSYNINKQIRFKTSMLRSDICDYSVGYAVVKGTIIVE